METLDDVREAILARQAELERANAEAAKAAEKAAAARAKADDAAARTFELEAAEKRRHAEQLVATYSEREDAIKQAIASQQQAFYAAVADDDMNAALVAYRGWRRERSRWWLADRDRQQAKSLLGHYGSSGPMESPVFTPTTTFADMLHAAVERVAGADFAEMDDAANAG